MRFSIVCRLYVTNRTNRGNGSQSWARPGPARRVVDETCWASARPLLRIGRNRFMLRRSSADERLGEVSGEQRGGGLAPSALALRTRPDVGTRGDALRQRSSVSPLVGASICRRGGFTPPSGEINWRGKLARLSGEINSPLQSQTETQPRIAPLLGGSVCRRGGFTPPSGEINGEVNWRD